MFKSSLREAPAPRASEAGFLHLELRRLSLLGNVSLRRLRVSIMLGAAALAALARVARQRFPRMRIFLVTGYTERLDEIERQGSPVLAKPFNVQQLLEALSAG